jgi:hypothetical protein
MSAGKGLETILPLTVQDQKKSWENERRSDNQFAVKSEMNMHAIPPGMVDGRGRIWIETVTSIPLVTFSVYHNIGPKLIMNSTNGIVGHILSKITGPVGSLMPEGSI